MPNALNGDNEDDGGDGYDDISARDCMGWEEDMIKKVM
jgi:hypothetical protein